MISCYEHVKNPIVVKEIDVYEFVEQIKQPKPLILELIDKARMHYGESEHLYNFNKLQLPCFTLNFSFNEKKANVNIKAPTGFIYLDLDNETDIDLTNELIFVSWKSISNKGRGILVKANGLTIDNFKNTYLSISKELGIEADKNAIKPSQYCLHSYDKDIYVNNDSVTWECKVIDIKESPITSLSKKKKKDRNETGVFSKLKFDNIDDYPFEDKDYLYFRDEKIRIASVFIPKNIKKGGRNNIISSIAFQIKALNPEIKFDDFYRLIISINYSHCKPVLNDDEIEKIINSAFDNEDSEPILNEERRFLFNPKKKLTHKEKMKIVNSINGKAKVEKTLKEIEIALINWDFKIQGKITINSLIKATGKCKNTIEKYYKYFKELRIRKNKEFKEFVSLK